MKVVLHNVDKQTRVPFTERLLSTFIDNICMCTLHIWKLTPYVAQAFALQLSLKRPDQGWKENQITMVNSSFVQNGCNIWVVNV